MVVSAGSIPVKLSGKNTPLMPIRTGYLPVSKPAREGLQTGLAE